MSIQPVRVLSLVILLVAAAVTSIGMSCDHPLDEDPLVLFDGDPAAVTLDSNVAYVCGSWIGGAPNVTWGLFDVLFGGSHTMAGTLLGPTEEHRQRIRGVGGQIVHEFNVPMIRTVLRPHTVPSLGANMVRGVPDAARFRIRGSIGWNDIEAHADTMYLKSLGVEIRGGYHTGTHGDGKDTTFDGRGHAVYHVTLPDSAIALIRAHPDVIYVEVSTYGCLDGG